MLLTHSIPSLVLRSSVCVLFSSLVLLYEDLFSSVPHNATLSTPAVAPPAAATGSPAAVLESTSYSSTSLSATSSSSAVTAAAAAAVVTVSQFTQREITISPSYDRLYGGDFGGVWLGEEADDSAAAECSAVTVGGKGACDADGLPMINRLAFFRFFDIRAIFGWRCGDITFDCNDERKFYFCALDYKIFRASSLIV